VIEISVYLATTAKPMNVMVQRSFATCNEFINEGQAKKPACLRYKAAGHKYPAAEELHFFLSSTASL
jgi:repressor of nif and glnA expression